MYNRTDWLDHVVERPRTYTAVDNEDGSYTYTAAPGEIIQQGTAMSADRFNNLEEGVLAANTAAMENFLQLHLHSSDIATFRKVLDLINHTVYEVTLTNTSNWPWNNSAKTVALNETRDNLYYNVFVDEIVDNVSNVGEIVVSDKQKNGFKIQYTGSAKAVTLKLHVEGGYSLEE